MRRRIYMLLAAMVVVIMGLTAWLAVALAQEDPTLPTTTPAQLLAQVAEQAPRTKAVGGEFSWSNDMFGAGMFESFHRGGSTSGDPGLDLLMKSGSGRLWLQGDRARLESQGSAGGDTIAVLDGKAKTLWVYSSATHTATKYTLPDLPAGMKPGGKGFSSTTLGGGTLGGATAVDLPAKIQEAIDEFAPHATLSVEQGVPVAGRAVYLLTMTPTAVNTAVGSAQVAIDGETYIPLQIQVFAKSDAAKPVLSAGFTRVSYNAIDPKMFAFTPPADAKMQEKALALPDMSGLKQMDAARKDAGSHKSLTLAEAEAKVGFPVLAPSGVTLPFKGAYVMPAQKLPEDLGKLGGGDGLATGGSNGGRDTTAKNPGLANAQQSLEVLQKMLPGMTIGPVVVSAYGDSFGTVALVQVKVDPLLALGLPSLLSQVPFFAQPVAMGDKSAYRIDAKLGSAAIWPQDGYVMVAAGLVPGGDLTSFVGSIR